MPAASIHQMSWFADTISGPFFRWDRLMRGRAQVGCESCWLWESGIGAWCEWGPICMCRGGFFTARACDGTDWLDLGSGVTTMVVPAFLAGDNL